MIAVAYFPRKISSKLLKCTCGHLYVMAEDIIMILLHYFARMVIFTNMNPLKKSVKDMMSTYYNLQYPKVKLTI